jgi:carbamoyltransferase
MIQSVCHLVLAGVHFLSIESKSAMKNKIILGIANSKDSSACLMVNGKLIAAVGEERFNRQKLTRAFPYQSIEWILDTNNLRTTDIDAIGTGVWAGIKSSKSFQTYLDDAFWAHRHDEQATKFISERFLASCQSDATQRELFTQGLRNMGLDRHPLYSCAHHHAHAITAFHFSTFDRAMVLTLDGRGDHCSGSVSVMMRGGEDKLISWFPEFNSLGYFYGWITSLLGFVPDRHEGKVTGLAALGDPKACRHILTKMIGFREGKIRSNIGRFYRPNATSKLPEIELELASYSREDIAAAAQDVLEDVVTACVRHYLSVTGERRLCVAGGIFANVLLNMRIAQLEEVVELFIFPHMGDGGIATGGAANASLKMGCDVEPLTSLYLGPTFSDQEILNELNKEGLRPVKIDSFEKELAQRLAAGQIVGLFNGRMEFGPRALGSRSIIAAATSPDINHVLNERLRRSDFMPFAPVTLADKSQLCYPGLALGNWNARFMTTCVPCSDFMKTVTPAVVHVDGTARPQIIDKDQNSTYYEILKSYFDLTGIPTLINTSFNRHEEPIVCRPADAISELKAGSIDVLGIYPYVVVNE